MALKINCRLCGSGYDFRMVQIRECLGEIGISLSGHVDQVNRKNAFKFCPECGRRLTDEYRCEEDDMRDEGSPLHLEMECGTLEIVERLVGDTGDVIIGKLIREEGEFDITYDCDEKFVMLHRWYELDKKAISKIKEEAAENFEWIKDAII